MHGWYVLSHVMTSIDLLDALVLFHHPITRIVLQRNITISVVSADNTTTQIHFYYTTNNFLPHILYICLHNINTEA